MKSLTCVLTNIISTLGGDTEGFLKARRAAEVSSKWKDAIEKVYGDAAPFILEHTNAVYILREEEKKKLVVYMDDSLVRSDIDARQEFIKLALSAAGEDLSSFHIAASRFRMKERHPYAPCGDRDSSTMNPFEKASRRPLTEEEKEEVDCIVSSVEDPRLRESLKAAITAEMEFHGTK